MLCLLVEPKGLVSRKIWGMQQLLPSLFCPFSPRNSNRISSQRSFMGGLHNVSLWKQQPQQGGMHMNWPSSLFPLPSLPHSKLLLRPEGMWLKGEESQEDLSHKEVETKGAELLGSKKRLPDSDSEVLYTFIVWLQTFLLFDSFIYCLMHSILQNIQY